MGVLEVGKGKDVCNGVWEFSTCGCEISEKPICHPHILNMKHATI